jgi:hypothetical protein
VFQAQYGVEGVAVGNNHDVYVRGGTELLCLASRFGSASNDLFGTVFECIVGDITQVGDLEVIREEPESWNVGNLGDFATTGWNISINWLQAVPLAMRFLPNYSHVKDPVTGGHLERVR